MTPRVVVAALVALVVGLVGGLAISRAGGDDLPADDSVAAGFARDMQTHHDQAVEMSWIIYDRTDDSLVRSLAYDIARTQESQSGQMAGWLQVWGLSPTGPGKNPGDVELPALGPVGMARWAWAQLTKMNTALFLLLLLAVAASAFAIWGSALYWWAGLLYARQTLDLMRSVPAVRARAAGR